MSTRAGTTYCDECAQEVECSIAIEGAWGSTRPLFGWSFQPNTFGYYNGFTDMPPNRDKEFTLCHDCVVRLLTLFPGLASTIAPGGHPFEGDTPCCDWGWSGDTEKLKMI